MLDRPRVLGPSPALVEAASPRSSAVAVPHPRRVVATGAPRAQATMASGSASAATTSWLAGPDRRVPPDDRQAPQAGEQGAATAPRPML